MRAESLRATGPAGHLAALLGWAACAGLCTLVLQMLTAALLPLLASPVLVSVPKAAPGNGAQAHAVAFLLQRMLTGPALETALLMPFAWAVLRLWELGPGVPVRGAKSLQWPQSTGLPRYLRLGGATGFLALPFTAVHSAGVGAQAWTALPAACLVVLALLIPLREGRPLHAAWSSFVVHSGHNALLLFAGWVLARPWPG